MDNHKADLAGAVPGEDLQAALCKNCKHWKRMTDAFDVSYHGPAAGNCLSHKFVYSPQDNKVPADGLEYYDAESYSAGFYTGENFGCIHWAARAALDRHPQAQQHGPR